MLNYACVTCYCLLMTWLYLVRIIWPLFVLRQWYYVNKVISSTCSQYKYHKWGFVPHWKTWHNITVLAGTCYGHTGWMVNMDYVLMIITWRDVSLLALVQEMLVWHCCRSSMRMRVRLRARAVGCDVIIAGDVLEAIHTASSKPITTC